MKNLLASILFTVVLVLQVIGQSNKIISTEEFKIVGKIKQELTVKLSDLSKLPTQKIKDVRIISPRNEYKSTLRKLRGVPIIELLKSVEFEVENPKSLTEFYFIFEASDGYRAVFSWSELFNSDTGKNVFIITEKDGVNLEKMNERIALLSPKDVQTGRRYVKNLAKIIVKRIE